MKLSKLAVAVVAGMLFSIPASAPVWGQSDQPSLGDVARANKSNTKSGRVITDENLPSASAPQTFSSAAAPSDSNSTAATGEMTTTAANDSSTTPDQPKDTANAPDATPPADVTQKKSPREERIAFLKRDQESLKGIMKQMQEKLAAETSDMRKETWSNVIQHSQEQIEDDQKEIDHLERSSDASPEPATQTPQ